MVSVTEEIVSDGCVRVILAEHFCLVLDTEKGFFNATELCNEYNKTKQSGLPLKELKNYHSLVGTGNLKEALMNLPQEPYKVIRNHPLIRGCTYFHPALMLDLALWISPQVYARTAAIIMAEIFHEEEGRRSKAAELFPSEEIAERTNINPQAWCIQYDEHEFTVDERGYFNSRDLYTWHEQLINFEEDKYYKPLIEYLKDRKLFDKLYYHPLLVLCWAARVGPAHFYVTWACVIFGCGDENLHSLFRRAIQAAAAEPHESDGDSGDSDPSDSNRSPPDEQPRWTSELVNIELSKQKREFEKIIEEERVTNYKLVKERLKAEDDLNAAKNQNQVDRNELERVTKQKRDRDAEYDKLLEKFEKLLIKCHSVRANAASSSSSSE